MSTVTRTQRWLELAGDWSNSILVKETRQALKSRQFVVTFMLLLVACWTMSMFGVLLSGEGIEYGEAGGSFFYVFYTVLMVAVLIIVPYGAFRSLLSEREQNTFELLSITALSPKQIVWGKLLSALVQVLIYYSAITPFIAFSSQLSGFDVPAAAYLLVVAVLASMGLSMISLMFSTAATQRQWQALNSVAVLGGLLFSFGWFMSVAMAVFAAGNFLDERSFWWVNGFALVGFTSYFILCRQITTAQLTFQSDNHSTGVRITCAAQFVLLWAGLVVYLLAEGVATVDREVVMALAVLSTLHLCVVGLFVTTESDFLSRRIRRTIPSNPLLRWVAIAFLPGGGRGYLYFVLQVIAMCAIVIILFATVFAPMSSSTPPVKLTVGEYLQYFLDGDAVAWTEQLQVVVCLVCYSIIYISVAAALGRWGRALSSEIKPAHVRVCALLVFGVALIGPYIPLVFMGPRRGGYRLYEISNPFMTIWEIQKRNGTGGVINFFSTVSTVFRERLEGHEFSEAVRLTWRSINARADSGIISLLLLGAACGLLVNLRAIKRSIDQIRHGEAVPYGRRQRRVQPAESALSAMRSESRPAPDEGGRTTEPDRVSDSEAT